MKNGGGLGCKFSPSPFFSIFFFFLPTLPLPPSACFVAPAAAHSSARRSSSSTALDVSLPASCNQKQSNLQWTPLWLNRADASSPPRSSSSPSHRLFSPCSVSARSTEAKFPPNHSAPPCRLHCSAQRGFPRSFLPLRLVTVPPSRPAPSRRHHCRSRLISVIRAIRDWFGAFRHHFGVIQNGFEAVRG